MKHAICAAPGRLDRLSQVLKIDSVRVCTPRYSLAPMSFSASNSASARPAAIAGRASGSVMSRASRHWPAPSTRAISISAAL
jgi:hypothetical protein